MATEDDRKQTRAARILDLKRQRAQRVYDDARGHLQDASNGVNVYGLLQEAYTACEGYYDYNMRDGMSLVQAYWERDLCEIALIACGRCRVEEQTSERVATDLAIREVVLTRYAGSGKISHGDQEIANQYDTKEAVEVSYQTAISHLRNIADREEDLGSLDLRILISAATAANRRFSANLFDGKGAIGRLVEIYDLGNRIVCLNTDDYVDNDSVFLADPLCRAGYAVALYEEMR